MTEEELSLNTWLKGRPKWIQEAAGRLFSKGSIEDQDIIDLMELCRKEAVKEFNEPIPELNNRISKYNAAVSIRLCSISDIEGINALSPKNPLDFGDGNLAVVYGQNGSGKSGYVRILKHACGARNPGYILPNVYSSEHSQHRCSIKYEQSDIEINHKWEVDSGPIEDLRCIDIYDANSGLEYIIRDNEVSYEPPQLSLFSELTSVCEKISTTIEAEIGKLPSKKPAMPAQFASSEPGQWYTVISFKTIPKEITAFCSWSDKENMELIEIQKRLSEQDPAKKAKQLHKQQEHVKNLIQDTRNFLEKFSDNKCKEIINQNRKVKQKQEAAKIAAEKAFSEAPLKGVGSEIWKQLWEKARQYSEEFAYKEGAYPYLGDDACCVLCHQPLIEEARKRLRTFEDYVKGELQKEANKAQESLDVLTEKLGDLPTQENLKTKADAGGLSPEDSTVLESLYSALNQRKAKLLVIENIEESESLPQSKELMDQLNQILNKYDDATKVCQDDAQTDNRTNLENKYLNLQAKKWLSQQIKAVEAEIVRLKTIEQLKDAKKLTNTKELSKKKGEVAEKLITDAYVERFSSELRQMGANKIKVELVKTKVEKGKVLHGLRLRGANRGSPSDILSEGESRIVSLAAFLADTDGKSKPSPFVFDDPISSLDQDFEESVVMRLIVLARERQVIIFTHRLSLLTLIQDYGKKAGLNPAVVCIRNEMWGTGEPGGIPLFAKKPEAALNGLLRERLPKARKLLEKEGWERYEQDAKSVCSDFRILLERMIENELLSDVVQRFRRAINTAGKIEKLSKINEQDCRFFDEMMTKYSRYEHSQPNDAPVPLPYPEEMKEDIEALKNWRDEFTKR